MLPWTCQAQNVLPKSWMCKNNHLNIVIVMLLCCPLTLLGWRVKCRITLSHDEPIFVLVDTSRDER